MKSSILSLFVVLAGFTVLSLASCSKDEVVVTVDSSKPEGTFTVSKTATILAQNNTNSKGTVEYGKDSNNAEFIKFGSDFETVLATGTVTVYLSTSQDFKADPANGNPDLRLIGTATKNGEMFYKLDPTLQSKFTHVILWCGSANIPFGYAKL